MKFKPLIIGNWKLNLFREEAFNLIEFIVKNTPASFKGDIAVAPVMVLLQSIAEKVHGSRIQVSAQNIFHMQNGAYTGESSVRHIKELGVSMAIVGHSERKQYFGETLQHVCLKIKACLLEQVVPVVCIGEKKIESAEIVLNKQLDYILTTISDAQFHNIIIAYEPIWAIGKKVKIDISRTEKIFKLLRKKIGNNTRLLYGGSVTPKNAKDLAQILNINGFLVGSASLSPSMFIEIIKAYL